MIQRLGSRKDDVNPTVVVMKRISRVTDTVNRVKNMPLTTQLCAIAGYGSELAMLLTAFGARTLKATHWVIILQSRFRFPVIINYTAERLNSLRSVTVPDSDAKRSHTGGQVVIDRMNIPDDAIQLVGLQCLVGINDQYPQALGVGWLVSQAVLENWNQETLRLAGRGGYR